MSRPGLIVGLGGTGQWVLTWLKRDLMLSNNGEMPNNVFLLAIDTYTQLEADVRRVANEREEEKVELGDVRLKPEEFIHIGGDSSDLAKRVKHGEYPNIGRWYQAQRWLDMLSPASFVLDDGAGKIRQFGRMAVFKDVLNEQVGSKIWSALFNAIDQVRQQTSPDNRLEIILVGSFAGGTGSGMFIDVALLLRLLAEKHAPHHILRGFFALPSVFTSAPQTDMLARTFAAWRELNRFMVVDSDFQMPIIEYVAGKDEYHITPNKRIFDSCYLVDSKRGDKPLAADPKYGVHPMVAEVISALLDESAGRFYTNFVSTNLAEEYASTPNLAMYSTIGALTIQVPAHYKQEVATHRFTQEMLLKLLSPRDRTLAAQGAERLLELAAPDQNLEVGPFPGRARCSQLLSTQSVTYEGETAKPTRFTARIDEIVKTATDKGRRATIVDALARAGGGVATKGGESRGWIGFFTDLGDDPTFEQLRKNVRAEVDWNVARDFMRQKGQTAEEVRDNMLKIPELIRNHLGGMLAGGQEFHGSFGDRLSEAKQFHMDLFRRLVRLRLLEILNGQSDEDQIKAKSGKLGYVWDYFDGLVVEFDEFLKLMQEVKARREELKPEIKIQGMAQNAKRYMEQNARKTILWWELPVVRGSEDAFLQAQQRVIDLRKEDLLHYYVVGTAQAFKEICQDARSAIERWVWHLATGDDPSQMPGLWSSVQTSFKNLVSDHDYDLKTEAVQRLIATQELQVAEENVAAALKQWEWNVDYVGAQQRLNLSAQILPEAGGEKLLSLTDPSAKTSMALRLQVSAENQKSLMTLGRRRYAEVAARTTVAEAIQAEVASAEKFINDYKLDKEAEPLQDLTQLTPRRRSNIIRVQAPQSDNFFYGKDGLQALLRRRANKPEERPDHFYSIQVVNSEHPYKLTLVRTDDLIQYDYFKAWDDCLRAYLHHLRDENERLQDPVLMHNFAAEAQAVVIERELSRGKSYDALEPRVVMLLEDPLALRQFVTLVMLGYVTPPNAEQRPQRWELMWERNGETQVFWLTRGWNTETDRNRKQPDIINAIHGYVVRRKSWRPRQEMTINPDYAETLIRAARRELGADQELARIQELALIQENLDPDNPEGWIGFLEGLVERKEDGQILKGKEYADLANVVAIYLKERRDDLLDQQRHGTGRGPFAGLGQRSTKQAPPPPPIMKKLQQQQPSAPEAAPKPKPSGGLKRAAAPSFLPSEGEEEIQKDTDTPEEGPQ